MADLNPNYSKRDYLLPPGCKDLIDVLNLKQPEEASRSELVAKIVPLPTQAAEGFTVEIAPNTTVKDLAEFLHVKPLGIIVALMEVGVFANINQVVDFDSASKLLAKYGYFAAKTT